MQFVVFTKVSMVLNDDEDDDKENIYTEFI